MEEGVAGHACVRLAGISQHYTHAPQDSSSGRNPQRSSPTLIYPLEYIRSSSLLLAAIVRGAWSDA